MTDREGLVLWLWTRTVLGVTISTNQAVPSDRFSVKGAEPIKSSMFKPNFHSDQAFIQTMQSCQHNRLSLCPNLTKHHQFSVITKLHFLFFSLLLFYFFLFSFCCACIRSILKKCSARRAEMKEKPSSPNKERCSFKGKLAISRDGCKWSDRALELIHAAWFRESQTAPVPGERPRRRCWNSSDNVSVIVFAAHQ